MCSFVQPQYGQNPTVKLRNKSCGSAYEKHGWSGFSSKLCSSALNCSDIPHLSLCTKSSNALSSCLPHTSNDSDHDADCGVEKHLWTRDKWFRDAMNMVGNLGESVKTRKCLRCPRRNNIWKFVLDSSQCLLNSDAYLSPTSRGFVWYYLRFPAFFSDEIGTSPFFLTKWRHDIVEKDFPSLLLLGHNVCPFSFLFLTIEWSCYLINNHQRGQQCVSDVWVEDEAPRCLTGTWYLGC